MSPVLFVSVSVLNGGSGVCRDAPCLDWVWHLALLCSPLRCPTFQCVHCRSIVDLGWCFSIRVMSLWNSGGGLCWGVEERWCVVCSSCCLSCLSCFALFCSRLLLSLRVGVRGSARAALRARTLSPNTIVFLCRCCLPSVSFLLAFLHAPSFLCVGMAVVCLPCVGALCWHDGNRESVSFFLVFLVVACSAFTVSAVASSAVAFGA